jgi:hypothetical protein
VAPPAALPAAVPVPVAPLVAGFAAVTPVGATGEAAGPFVPCPRSPSWLQANCNAKSDASETPVTRRFITMSS